MKIRTMGEVNMAKYLHAAWRLSKTTTTEAQLENIPQYKKGQPHAGKGLQSFLITSRKVQSPFLSENGNPVISEENKKEHQFWQKNYKAFEERKAKNIKRNNGDFLKDIQSIKGKLFS